MRPRAASFVISATRPADFPPGDLPEVAFAGRSNVGKSSLINALTDHAGLARTSRTPGRTRLLNWFRVETGKVVAGHDALHFVDLPGYGYAAVDRDLRASWRPLMESYLGERPALRAVVLLMDIRREVSHDELDFVPWLLERKLAVIPVMTKADKLGKAQRLPIAAAVKRDLGLPRMPLLFSAQDKLGIDELWKAIFAGLKRG